jgi:hypothetical protein
MRNIQNPYQLKTIYTIFDFYLRNEKKSFILCNVFHIFGTISSDVPSTSLEVMAQNNK